MSYLKLRRTQDIGVEVQAECQACGLGLLSDVVEDNWRGAAVVSGARIVVKVQPFCARCLRERDERMKGTEIAGNNNEMGGSRS